MIMIFLVDACVNLSVIMKSKEYNLELIFVFFNILVMNVFNMTQFHLFFWTASLISKKIAHKLNNRYFSKIV
jgi:hypothetical protein